MGCTGRSDAYNPFAWFYDTHFDFHDHALFILDKLLLDKLPRGSRILDLGCGTGHLAQALIVRGYDVVGIDGSTEMLFYAKRRVPEGDFMVADARDFSMPLPFHAVVSTFDCMNHMMSLDELSSVSGNVFNSLEEGGFFLFDLNMEEAFETQWHKSASIIKDDHVCIIEGGYDTHARTGMTRLTLFILEESWKRSDVTLYQKCYSPEEVTSVLERSGFKEVSLYNAGDDLKMPGHLAVGRTVFVAKR